MKWDHYAFLFLKMKKNFFWDEVSEVIIGDPVNIREDILKLWLDGLTGMTFKIDIEMDLYRRGRGEFQIDYAFCEG